MNGIKRSFFIIGAASMCALSTWADDSSAVVILRRTTNAPAIPYQGTVTVGIRQDKGMRFEDVKVRFKPPNLYRWEYMAPDGKVERAVVTHKEPGLQLAKQEWNLLMANYAVKVTGVDNVIGRPVWQLELTPKVPGKCHRRMLIDQQTGIILENKKFRPNKNETVMSRFVRFEAPAYFSDSLFNQHPAHVEKPGMCARVHSAQRKPAPQTLPNGFQLVGANAMQVGDNVVAQLRYSDGLTTISVFQTFQPVNTADAHRPTMSINHVVSQPVEDGHVTLIGDVPNELLQEMALAFNK